ncbi:hypothetical protein KM043_002235 [Ampulex compressa]|nr:hypothetical protein KM043_002235 [Ampulex compressa]
MLTQEKEERKENPSWRRAQRADINPGTVIAVRPLIPGPVLSANETPRLKKPRLIIQPLAAREVQPLRCAKSRRIPDEIPPVNRDGGQPVARETSGEIMPPLCKTCRNYAQLRELSFSNLSSPLLSQQRVYPGRHLCCLESALPDLGLKSFCGICVSVWLLVLWKMCWEGIDGDELLVIPPATMAAFCQPTRNHRFSPGPGRISPAPFCGALVAIPKSSPGSYLRRERLFCPSPGSFDDTGKNNEADFWRWLRKFWWLWWSTGEIAKEEEKGFLIEILMMVEDLTLEGLD